MTFHIRWCAAIGGGGPSGLATTASSMCDLGREHYFRAGANEFAHRPNLARTILQDPSLNRHYEAKMKSQAKAVIDMGAARAYLST